MSERLLQVPDVAERLQVSKAQVYRLVALRELAAVRVGRRTLRFRAEDVERFVSERETVKG